MATSLTNAIVKKIFGEYSGNRLVIVENYDGFLGREDVRFRLAHSNLKINEGDSLCLRLWWENTIKEEINNENSTLRFVFVKTTDFTLAEDIEQLADQNRFMARSLFPRYKWDLIKDCSFNELEYLFNLPGRVSVSELQTRVILDLYESQHKKTTIEITDIQKKWHDQIDEINISKTNEWMPKASDLIHKAIAIGKYEELYQEVNNLNQKFQEYLKQHYSAVVSSTTPPRDRAPKIVTQVLPYIGKQVNERIALIVVDGMNFWQGQMLINSLQDTFDLDVVTHTIYSWLPSVTELSRQAIFIGQYPKENYTQNWENESKMWEHFWESRGYRKQQILYEYSRHLAVKDIQKRIAFVTVDLDEKMHASDDFRYLHAATEIWVKEPAILDAVGDLLQAGFTIYITTDHGNTETHPTHALTQGEKVGSPSFSKRHITLAPQANRSLFEADHTGDIMQIDINSRTYYPKGDGTFTNHPAGVTHGGTHFLEVLIPFIKLTLKQKSE